jgi:hypothetical protein
MPNGAGAGAGNRAPDPWEGAAASAVSADHIRKVTRERGTGCDSDADADAAAGDAAH